MKSRSLRLALTIADAQSRTAAAVYQTLSRIHRSLRQCVEGELAGPARPA